MDIKAVDAANARDVRPALFLGMANWFLFLDHIPNDFVSWLTVRNYGFSGAADIFVLVSGYTAANVYAKMMLERGFIIGATRVFRQVWRLYAAYVVLFVIYVVTIGDVASRYAAPDIIFEFNVAGMVDHPLRTLTHGLMLQSKPLNLDMLQLYIGLMALFPPALWVMLRKPGLVMVGSLALYVAAGQLGWNLPSFPEGSWYFNPFRWQLLFFLGAWLVLGAAKPYDSILKSRALFYVATAYLIFALAMTMAGRFPELAKFIPPWQMDSLNAEDKTNLAPYRALHVAAVACFVTRLVSRDWDALQWYIFRPAIKCGQQSVAVFCVGVFLSFAGHFLLMTGSGSLRAQLVVSAAGMAIMTIVAYYISWSQRQDHLSAQLA
jgi:hypothetical protein